MYEIPDVYPEDLPIATFTWQEDVVLLKDYCQYTCDQLTSDLRKQGKDVTSTVKVVEHFWNGLGNSIAHKGRPLAKFVTVEVTGKDTQDLSLLVLSEKITSWTDIPRFTTKVFQFKTQVVS